MLVLPLRTLPLEHYQKQVLVQVRLLVEPVVIQQEYNQAARVAQRVAQCLQAVEHKLFLEPKE
jgi:hypothetical protein